MSKSKGNAVTPASLVERFGVDAYRYYFLRDVQFGTDGSISMEGMVQRYNGDLANDWGNLVSRLLNMTEKYCDGLVPAPPAAPDAADAELLAIAAGLPDAYEQRMRGLDYAGALESAWDLVKRANRYIEDSAPWNLAKTDETRPRLEAVLYNALEAVRIAALFTAPVMPNTSAEVWRRLGLGDVTAVTDLAAASAWGGLPEGSRVSKGERALPAHLRGRRAVDVAEERERGPSTDRAAQPRSRSCPISGRASRTRTRTSTCSTTRRARWSAPRWPASRSSRPSPT